MKKIMTAVVLFLLCASADADDIKFSAITDADKAEAVDKAAGILDTLSKHSYEDLGNYFVSDEANFGGVMWMPVKNYFGFIKSITSKDYRFSGIKAYTFDECRNDPKVLEYARKMYKVFDNFSIMVIADALEKEKNKASRVGIIFVRNHTSKKWEAYSVFGLDVNMIVVGDEKRQKEYPIMKFQSLSLELPVHTSFERMPSDGRVINFFMKGKTPRDAAIQIVYFPKKGELFPLSYSWLMHNLKNRRSTGITARCFQNGYRYECNLLGNDNIPNKMIITALENRDYIIFINFFSYLECYREKKPLFDYGLNNIKIVE